MPRPRLRDVVVGVVSLMALVQLAAVTLASLPPNRYSDAAAPATSYLDPYFTQNWRLFAPNPVAEDRSVRFRGAYTDETGAVRLTPWVDWTEVELDLVHHRVVGGRAGYITNKLFSPLRTRFGALTTAQRQVAADTTTDPLTWSELESELEAAGDEADAAAFLRYERATTQLGTDVLMSRWPDRDLVAVQYALRRHAVVPYANRNGSKGERDAARPAATERGSGWRIPTPGDDAERRAVASFDRRHR